jgi:hypothetical protein
MTLPEAFRVLVSGLPSARSNSLKAGDNVWNNADLGGLYRRGFLWGPSK